MNVLKSDTQVVLCKYVNVLCSVYIVGLLVHLLLYKMDS